MGDIRVFISIPIPDRSALAGPSAELDRVRNVRTSPLDQVHITLRFIGDMDESRLDDVEACVIRAAEGTSPFTVTVSGTGAFPNRNRASVVWVGASPQRTMSALADAIGRNLDSAGIGYDRKPFKSHITLARCRGPADLSGFFDKYDSRDLLRFECDRILVMKSTLGPSGAKHTVLREIRLA